MDFFSGLDEGGIFLCNRKSTLVVLQNLTRHQADVLADVVQTAEGINGGVTFAGHSLKRFTLLYLVEVRLWRK